MSAVYDNWEKLVGATLRREHFRLRALRSFSDLSLASSSSFNSRASSHPLSFNFLRIFTFAGLKSATRNFRPDTELGERGFWRVFKGWVDEKTYASSRVGVGMAITIKLFDPKSELDLEACQAEIEFLGKFSHPNMVKLLGYCLEDNRFLLVYEYMPNGSLEDHLFRRWTETLSWDIRMKIAIGTARALAFLHTTEGQVIHIDIKAANILLDEDYNGKLSNFGPAKLGLYSVNSHVSTQVLGTDSYVAPEYMVTGNLDVKSHVYSFGVLLLQIVSGRRVFDPNRPVGEQNLITWVRSLLSDRRSSRRIIDSRLKGLYPTKAVFQLANLILKCLEHYPNNRPPMEKVLETLEQIGTLKKKLNDSESNHKWAEQPKEHRHLKFQLLPPHP